MMTKRLGSGLLALFLVSSVAVPEELFAPSHSDVVKPKKGIKRRLSSWARRKRAGVKSATELRKEKERSKTYFKSEAERAKRKRQQQEARRQEMEGRSERFS